MVVSEAQRWVSLAHCLLRTDRTADKGSEKI